MRIKSIRVENFRSVRSATLNLDGLTALVGATGAGKSTFLRALLAFQGKEKPSAEDFYNRHTAEEIAIAVTFTGLPGAAKKKFARYLHGGDLEVTRVYKHSSNSDAVESSLHGRALRNGDFAGARAAASAGDAVAEYDRLRARPEYADLPKCRTGKAAREALDQWEDDNPDKCRRLADDGSFFGFEGAAEGRLGQFIRMLYVPAVREATGDGTEGGRGSVLHELLELTVKGALAGSARHQRLQKEADALYEKARNMGAIPEVKRLEGGGRGRHAGAAAARNASAAGARNAGARAACRRRGRPAPPPVTDREPSRTAVMRPAGKGQPPPPPPLLARRRQRRRPACRAPPAHVMAAGRGRSGCGGAPSPPPPLAAHPPRRRRWRRTGARLPPRRRRRTSRGRPSACPARRRGRSRSLCTCR